MRQGTNKNTTISLLERGAETKSRDICSGRVGGDAGGDGAASEMVLERRG